MDRIKDVKNNQKKLNIFIKQQNNLKMSSVNEDEDNSYSTSNNRK